MVFVNDHPLKSPLDAGVEDDTPMGLGAQPAKGGHHARIDSKAFLNFSKELNVVDNERLVVVRYYLDRPGYGLHNSAARLWVSRVHCTVAIAIAIAMDLTIAIVVVIATIPIATDITITAAVVIAIQFHPPVACKPVDVKDFLEKQGIALPGTNFVS